MKTIRVQFKKGGKVYNFNDTNETLQVGDYAIVATVNGTSIVEVIGIEDEANQAHTPVVCKLTVNLAEKEMVILVHEMGIEYLIVNEWVCHDLLYMLNRLIKKPDGFNKRHVIESESGVTIMEFKQNQNEITLVSLAEFETYQKFVNDYLFQMPIAGIREAPIEKGEYYVRVEKGVEIENTFKSYYNGWAGEDAAKEYFRKFAPENAKLYITSSCAGEELAIYKDHCSNGYEDNEFAEFPDSPFFDWVHHVMKTQVNDMKKFYLDDLTSYRFTFLKSIPLEKSLENDSYNIVKNELVAVGKYEAFVFSEVEEYSFDDWETIECSTDFSVYANTIE